MEQNISAILVGVGGQGTILTAKVLVNGLMRAGYDVKMSEVHGMSQRGGSVSTQVHWGRKVYSPVIGKGAADIIVAFEKMEAVRYADYLKQDGIAVINDFEIESSTTAAGMCEYPKGCIEAMKSRFNCYTLNAAKIAEDMGNPKCMNIVLFGSMVKVLGMDDIEWESVIADTVPEKFR
ncbi:MAG: indolepyruvate oxidoreductase subunit beta, partial [Eubacteriales bacterium]|nr:indolepyruvate oxidoreductase subunit beta [Eubacteriales bacterium]